MSVRVTVEGGGSFELDDEQVKDVRRDAPHWSPSFAIMRKLAAALPPEPYQPKEGDRVQYRWSDESQWSPLTWIYLGTFREWNVIHVENPGKRLPVCVPADAEFKRVES